MKCLGLIVLLSYQSYCMQDALKAAIQQSNLPKVQKLLAQTNRAHQPTETEPIQSKSVNLAQLHQFATQLTAERQALTEYRTHPAVYNRLLMGGGTILVSFFAIGNYFYQAISTKQPDFQSLCAATVAGGTAIVHGCKEINLGIQNQDAKDAHANHLAITHLLLNAQNEQDCQAIV